MAETYNQPFYEPYLKEYFQITLGSKSKAYDDNHLDWLHAMIDAFYRHFFYPTEIKLTTVENNFEPLADQINTFFKRYRDTTIKAGFIADIYNKSNKSPTKSVIKVEAIRIFITAYCDFHNITIPPKQPDDEHQVGPIVDRIEQLLSEKLVAEAEKEYAALKTQFHGTLNEYWQARVDFVHAQILRKTHRDFGQEIYFLQKVLPIFVKHQSHKKIVNVYTHLLNCKAALKDHISVELYGKALVEEMKKNDTQFMVAWAYHHVGHAFSGMGLQTEALKNWDLAIHTANELHNSINETDKELANHILATTYTSKCSVYVDQGDFLNAKSFSIKALKTYAIVGTEKPEEYGLLCYYLAQIEAMDNNIDSEKFNEAIISAKKMMRNHKTGYMNCIILEAKAEAHKKNFKKAAALVDELHVLSLELKDMRLLCSYLKECAIISEQIEDFLRASDLYTELFEIAVKHKLHEAELDAFTAINPHTLIQIFSEEKRKRLYILLDKCLSEFNYDNPDKNKITLLRKVAEVYYMLNDLNKAIRINTRVLKLYRNDDIFEKATILLSLSDTHMLTGDTQTAMELIVECCTMLRGSVFHELNGTANLMAASLFAHFGDINIAQSYNNATENLVHEYKLPPLLERGIKFVQDLIDSRKEKK